MASDDVSNSDEPRTSAMIVRVQPNSASDSGVVVTLTTLAQVAAAQPAVQRAATADIDTAVGLFRDWVKESRNALVGDGPMEPGR